MKRSLRCRRARDRVVIVNSRCDACEEWVEIVRDEKMNKANQV
jgi:hypothetical protein